MKKKNCYYGQYIIRKCEFGYFAEPIHQDMNKERWGNSPTFKTVVEVETWCDEH